MKCVRIENEGAVQSWFRTGQKDGKEEIIMKQQEDIMCS